MENFEFKSLEGIAPEGWKLIKQWGEGFAYGESGGLRVIVDAEFKEDGKRWIHVSVSRLSKMPSHEDMQIVKRAFIGEDRYAYVVWPPKKFYVNINPYVLHIWALINSEDGKVLPEFSAILDGIGRSI